MKRRRSRSLRIGRRHFLMGLGAAAATASLATPAAAQAILDAATFGLTAGSAADQTAVLEAALRAAAEQGRPLLLPRGDYFVRNLLIPSGVKVEGVLGATSLVSLGDDPVARIEAGSNITLEGLTFAPGTGSPRGDRGLLEIEQSARIALSHCGFVDSDGNGIVARGSAVSIDHCDFNGQGQAAIFSLDSDGLLITNNVIANCGNGGVLIWGSSSRRDGSIIMGNVISKIAAEGGGNGQNGNGINVFKADQVIVSDNHIAGCAFTAIRLNSTNNTQVRGNTCINSGEVAIFSEFAFSGSVIADNIVDGAAAGISITNLDEGGRLAACSGNIVRNIAPRSLVNPDTAPVGIYAEADTAITGNVVDGVPGIGIAAGFGPYLRNVLVAHNLIGGVNIGVGVSVVQDPKPGRVRVAGNMISGPLEHGIVGLEWGKIVSDDLVRDAGRYPNVTIADNTITRI